MNTTRLRLALGASLLALAGTTAAQVAVIVSPATPTLSKEEIANIYLGRTFEFKPIDLPENSPLRETFYRKGTDRDLAQVKSTWARIAFSNKGQPPRELPDSAAVRKAVAADPKAIGYIEKAAVDGTVKVVVILE